MDDHEALRLAAAVERRSEHPLAHAIIQEARQRRLIIPECNDFRTVPGDGVTGRANGHAIHLGTIDFIEAEGTHEPAARIRADAISSRGQTPVCMSVDGCAVAVFGVSDPLKPEAPGAIAALRRSGVRVVMVTGDRELTARSIARQVGISEVVAGVRPDGKAGALARLREELPHGGKLVFVGDGINDAPALAAADVGMAIGTGSDIAIESADVVLMSGDTRKIPAAVAISRAAIRNIKQNLFWAFAYNSALIPVAAGVLYPAFGILLSPVLASAAMAASSVCVVANALRLRKFNAPPIKDEKT
jgi:Cu+-exporting ATPase